jgi:Flp pilus assembly protein TadG
VRRDIGGRQKGQSLVEFAVVVPLFLLLLFGLIDFARLAFTYVSLSNGARELARSASISESWTLSPTSASNAAIAAMNNYTIIADRQNGATDNVTVVVGDASCAHTQDTGGTCANPHATSQTVCSMPLSQATCTLPQPKPGGFVEVQVSYTFHFNPLFQTRLDGIVDVSFMRPTALVTTTSRAYVE